jgi:hypothetical protein
MMQLDALILPDLTWTDPFDTQAVAVVSRRRLNGALTIFPRALSGGRPITLEAPADQPLTYAQAAALAAMAADPSGTFALSMPLRGLSFSVRFRWEDGNPLDLQPLIDYSDPADDDPVVGTIQLITL